jgi:hypothetical protein
MAKIDAMGIGGCLALMGAVYLAGFGPLIHDRAERAAQRNELGERQQQVASLQETLRGLTDRRRIYEVELAHHPVKLHPASDINQRLAAIVSLAEETGLKVPDIAPQTPKSDQRFTVLPIRLKGTGGYPTAADFFAGLHREFKDTAVTAFTLTAPDPTDGGSSEWTANLVGPPAPPFPARAEFVFDLEWFAAPNDHGAGAAK